MSPSKPPYRAPLVEKDLTISRAWWRWASSVSDATPSGGQVPVPTPENALNFVRVNKDGTLYETQTPEQVLQDIGGLSAGEAAGLFEPLLDTYNTQYSDYQVKQTDTGIPILMVTAGSTCVLPGQMIQGTKVVVSSGAGAILAGDGAAFLNGNAINSYNLGPGTSAICEVVENKTSANAEWSVTIDGTTLEWNGFTATNIDTFVLEGDLSFQYGNAPIIVQSATLNNVTGTVTLSLPEPVTPGNLLLASCINYTGGPATISGFSAISTASGNAVFTAPATITSQNTLVAIFDNPAGGSQSALAFHEVSGAFQVLPGLSQIGTQTSSGLIVAGPIGTLQAVPSLLYGIVASPQVAFDPSGPNFYNPQPLDLSIGATLWGDQGFEGAPIVGAELIFFNTQSPQTFSVQAESLTTDFVFASVQLVGSPGNNTATITGAPTIVLDGLSITPTINTGGMISANGNNLDAYIIIEDNGTVQNSLVTTLDFQGGGVSFSGTGPVETITIPGEIFIQGSLTATGQATLGTGLSLTGTLNPTITASGGVVANVGTTSQTVGTLSAGSNISFSGAAPNLTIAAASTLATTTVIENAGTSIGSVGTINAGSGVTASVSGGIATLTASATGGGGDPLYLFSPPSAAGFSAITGDGSTPSFSTVGVCTVLDCGPLVSGSGGIVVRGAVTPIVSGSAFTATFRIIPAVSQVDFTRWGVVLQDTTTGKLRMFGRVYVSTTSPIENLVISYWNSLSSFSSESDLDAVFDTEIYYYRVHLASGTLTYSISKDSVLWQVVFQEALTAWGSAITNIGIMVMPYVSGTLSIAQDAYLNFAYFAQTTP